MTASSTALALPRVMPGAGLLPAIAQALDLRADDRIRFSEVVDLLADRNAQGRRLAIHHATLKPCVNTMMDPISDHQRARTRNPGK